jgi:hypothetical protein
VFCCAGALGCSEDNKSPEQDSSSADSRSADSRSDSALIQDSRSEDGASGGDVALPDLGQPDIDLGDDFGLLVASGVQACSHGTINTSDLSKTMEGKGRITFKPGFYRLFKDKAQFTLDMVKLLELGPQRTKGVPTGAGQVVRTINSSAYTYTFTQLFDVGGTPVELKVPVTYQVQTGTPLDKIQTLDEASLSKREINASVAVKGSTAVSIYFGPCSYSLYGCTIHEFELSGNDQLKMEVCSYCPTTWICKANYAGLPRARFESGSTVRDLTDHFNLSQSFRHHNWGSDSLIIFDTPVQKIHGIYIGTEVYPNFTQYKQASYLDASFKEIETRQVIKHTSGGSW